MGIQTSTSGGGGNYETEVVLNVYDLTPLNNYVSWFGFGIFHSGIEGPGLGSLSLSTYGKIGIEKNVMSKSSKAMTALIKHAMKLKVHGMEYGFGAHDFPISGVFEVEPKSCPGFIYRCSVPLGRIDIPPSEFREFVETVASEYHGDSYHLISKNCNHFTDDMSLRLTGKSIPGWVNRLAKLGAFCNCLLPESLQKTTVKQIPEHHSYAEDDASGSLSTTSPHEPIESDDSEKDTKQLLSPTSGTDDVAFITEVQRLFEAVS